MTNKTGLDGIDFSKYDKLQEETSGMKPELMNPDVASLEIKGGQFNELTELSKRAGVDRENLLADPASAPAVKANASLTSINEKNPRLGQHLAKSENQLMWWDKLDIIDQSANPVERAINSSWNMMERAVSTVVPWYAKPAVTALARTETAEYIKDSQSMRILGVTDFLAQNAKVYDKYALAPMSLDKLLGNKPKTTEAIEDYQKSVVEAKQAISNGMLQDPNLAQRTADGIVTIGSYAVLGWMTAGQGTALLGYAEGGGMGVEEGRKAGLSDEATLALGHAQGGVSAITEALSFGLGGKIATTQIGQSVLRNKFARGLVKYLSAGGAEMVEENVEMGGHVWLQNRFGIDSQYALETDPAIFLSAMLFHGAHQARAKIARTNMAQNLSGHLDQSIALADNISENIPKGDLAKLLNARDDGLSLTFDAVELDVATETNPELRQKIISVVGEQKYLDAVARGDKVEITIGDYVETLRADHDTLKGMAEYENTKISATSSEQTRATALNELISLSEMQTYINQVNSIDIDNNSSYQRLSSAMREQLSQVSFKSETAKENYIEFFSRIASHLVDMQAKASEQAGVAFDIEDFITSYMPTIMSAPSGGNRAREFMKQVVDAFASGKGVEEIRKGMTAQQLLAMNNLPTSAEGDADLMKSYRALVQAGYLQDVETDEEAMSLLSGALAEPTYLPEGSETLSTYKEIADALDKLTAMGNTMEQAYQTILDSLAISDPTISFESLRQMREEFNITIAEAEFNQTALMLGGEEAYNKADTDLTYQLWVKVRTPRFKAWFGDWENDPENASKVINPRTGEPLVVYHGTRSTKKPHHIFDRDESFRGRPIFASTDERIASTYTEISGNNPERLEVKFVDNEFKVYTKPDEVQMELWDVQRTWGDVEMEGIGKLVHIGGVDGYYERLVRNSDEFKDGRIILDEADLMYYYADTKEPVYAFEGYEDNGNLYSWVGNIEGDGDEFEFARSADWKKEYIKERGDILSKGNVYELFLNIRDPYKADFRGNNWNSYEGNPRLNVEASDLIKKVCETYNNGEEMIFDTKAQAEEFLTKVLLENTTAEITGQSEQGSDILSYKAFGVIYHSIFLPKSTEEVVHIMSSGKVLRSDSRLDDMSTPEAIAVVVNMAVNKGDLIDVAFRDTNELAREAESMGHDGAVFKNVIDSASIYYMQESTVYTFHDSKQAKSIYNIGSWSPSNEDILRQMVREDYRKQFVEAEKALNGTTGYKESGSKLSYVMWVASHTKDYKNGIPWYVIAEKETDISNPLYQHTYKGLPTDRWFFNPVVRSIRDFPAKAFGEGGNKVATIKQWIDKLKSSSFNKDFMARTRIFRTLDEMQASYEEAKRAEKENPKENPLPEDFGKLSKSDVINLLGDGWELVADITSKRIALDINLNPIDANQRIDGRDYIVTDDEKKSIINAMIDDLGISLADIEQNFVADYDARSGAYINGRDNPWGNREHIDNYLNRMFSDNKDFLDNQPQWLKKETYQIYALKFDAFDILVMMQNMGHAKQDANGEISIIKDGVVLSDNNIDSAIIAQNILDEILAEAEKNAVSVLGHPIAYAKNNNGAMTVLSDRDIQDEFHTLYEVKWFEKKAGDTAKDKAVDEFSKDLTSDTWVQVLNAIVSKGVHNHYFQTSLKHEASITEEINHLYRLASLKMTDNGMSRIKKASAELQAVKNKDSYDLQENESKNKAYKKELSEAMKNVENAVRDLVKRMDIKALSVMPYEKWRASAGVYAMQDFEVQSLKNNEEFTGIVDKAREAIVQKLLTLGLNDMTRMFSVVNFLQPIYYNKALDRYTTFKPDEIFSKLAMYSEHRPVRADSIEDWARANFDPQRVFIRVYDELQGDFEYGWGRYLSNTRDKYYSNKYRGKVQDSTMLLETEFVLDPSLGRDTLVDLILNNIRVPQYVIDLDSQYPRDQKMADMIMSESALIATYEAMNSPNDVVSIEQIQFISSIEDSRIGFVAVINKLVDKRTGRVKYGVGYKGVSPDAKRIPTGDLYADASYYDSISDARNRLLQDIPRIENVFADVAKDYGIDQDILSAQEGFPYESVDYLNKYIEGSGYYQGAYPNTYDYQTREYNIAPVETGFSSIQEAVEYMFAQQIEDRVAREKVVSYHRYETDYVSSVFQKAFKDRGMSVKYSDSYAKTAKGDPSVVEHFNIVLRLPNSKNEFMYTAHVTSGDGYEYNITCLVMGNVRNFVRPDGTVVRALFIEEVQSDWEQTTRKGYKSIKEQQASKRMGYIANFIASTDWEAVSDEDFAKHDAFLSDWAKWQEALYEEHSKEIAEKEVLLEQAMLERDESQVRFLRSEIKDLVDILAQEGKALPIRGGTDFFNSDDLLKYKEHNKIQMFTGRDGYNALAYAKRKGMESPFNFVQTIIKGSSGEAYFENLKDRQFTDFYIAQEPAMQMVRAIVMMSADPAIFAKWGVTDVVFGSAKTVSVHNQAVNFIPKDTALVLKSEPDGRVRVKYVDEYDNTKNQETVNLWDLQKSVGTDMVEQFQEHYLKTLSGEEKRQAKFVYVKPLEVPSDKMVFKEVIEGFPLEADLPAKAPLADYRHKLPPNDNKYVYFDIGKTFMDTPVLTAVHKNAIGLVSQYDKKAPKDIERNVKRMGGIVEEYRMEYRGNLVDENESSKLKANEIPLIGYQIAPLQKFYTENPELAKASLFQKEILVEGAYDRMNRFIRQFNKDNISTLCHEGAHWYLDVLQMMANGKDGEKNYPMFHKIAQEFQFNPFTPIPDEAHERFARAFEQFMLEGKSPSDDAKLLMANMKEEFKRQYMNAQSVGETSPVMDEIFGGIISADNATAEEFAPPAFTNENAKLLGLSEPQIRAYHRLKALEAEDASSEVRQKTLDLVQARKTQKYKDDLKEQTRFALDQMSMDDMNFLDEKVASYFLTGKKPNGNSINIPHVKLDKQATIEAVGEELASQLPPSVFSRTKGTKSVSPTEDVLLNLFGLGNAEELVNSIIKGQGYKDSAKAEGMANADALAEQGDESAKALAEIAVHNNRRINNLMFELDTIAKVLNTKPPTLNQIREVVDKDIANLSLKELSKYRSTLLAERKAGKSAFTAIQKGDLPTALNQKLTELLNAVRYDRMVVAHQAMTKKVSWIKDKGQKKSYQKIGKSGAVFVDAYESVLAYIGMADPANTKSMTQVVNDIQDMGYIVQASDELVTKIDNRQPRFLDEMSAQEVNEIYDLFRNIRLFGRNTLSILLDGRRVDREEIVAGIVKGVTTNLTGKPVPFDPETQGILERSNSYRKQAIADLYRMDAIAGWIDGEDTQGMFHSAIWQPLNDAQYRKNEILRDLYEPLGELNNKLTTAIGKDALQKRYTMPWKDENGEPVVVTRQWMIAFALNSGNASSLERMGNQFSQSDINYVLSNLTKAELEYVQNVWDLLDTLWQDIVALERRMTGVTPERVLPVARTLRIKDGSYVTLKGGYFPLVYDRESKEYADAFGSDADQLLGKGVMPATTSHGFTKSRAKTVKIPIKFDLMNILSHLEEVAHDLSHREAVVNAWQLMNHPDIKGAFIENGRIATYNMIRSKIKQIAQNDSLDVKGLNAVRKLSRHLRSGISASAMGLSTVTMTKQLIGLSQSVSRLSLASGSAYGGFKYTAQGMVDGLAKGFREQAIAESGFMADRIDSVNLDVKRQMQRRIQNKMGLGKVSDVISPLVWLKDRAFVPMAWVQFNFVDMPTYLGAKRLGAKQGLTGKALINFAEGQVRRSQGAGDVKDVALIENVAFLELFIPFYSYASAYLNEQITILQKAGQAKKAKRLTVEAPMIATSLAMLTLTPMILDTLISVMLGKTELPDEDDDEEYWLTLLKFFGVKYALEATTFGIPLVRDVGSQMSRAINEEPQFQTSRGLDVVSQNLTKLYSHAKDIFDENEEVDGKKLIKDLATTTTILTGIPLNKPLSHLDALLYEMENGDGDFGSPEFWLNFYGGSRNEEEQ